MGHALGWARAGKPRQTIVLSNPAQPKRSGLRAARPSAPKISHYCSQPYGSVGFTKVLLP